MNQYVSDLPESEQRSEMHHDPTDEGLAKEVKDAGLTAHNRPARETNRRRPFGVAAAAFLMLASSAWMMPFIFILEPGLGEIPSVPLGAAISIMTLFGVMASMAMFMVKRWSVYLYTAVVIATNLIFLALGEWNPIHLILPLVVLAISYSQIKHLR